MVSRLDRTKPDKIHGIPVTGLANLRWLLLQLQWSRSEQVQRCSNMVQTFCKLSSRLNSQCNLAFVAADSGAVGCKDHQKPCMAWYTRASIEFHHSNTEIIYGSQNPGWDLVHIQVVQGLPLSPCLAGVFFSVYFGAFSKRSAEEYPLRWSTETQGRWFSLGKGVLCLGSQQLLINYCSYRCCHLLFPDMFIKIQTLCL